MGDKLTTARELIIQLLDVPSHYVIVAKDKEGNELRDVEIVAREDPRVVGCLFG
jgi:hypothetical protein